MIKRRGDLFSTDAPAIGHGVNTDGVMGSGIAVLFREKFPKNYLAYKKNCELRFLRAGETFVYHESDLYIFNIASQAAPGANAEYRHVLRAGADAANQAVSMGIDRIAIPLIGCGIGGLEWEKVEPILETIESVYANFEWEVWKL